MSLPALYYQDDACTIYHGDCRELLPLLAADSVDLTLTDPPYNVGKQYGAHDDRMEAAEYQGWLAGILAGCARVSRDGVVFFPGTANVLAVTALLSTTTLRPVRMLGWHRKEFAGDKWMGGPAMCWEPVVWASKAEKPHFNRIFGNWGRDFLVVPSVHGNGYAKLHPCPKPKIVMDWLVGLFAPNGGVILDPFVGTGTTLLSAKNLHRKAIGIEIEERYCEIAAKRLAQEVLPLEMA